MRETLAARSSGDFGARGPALIGSAGKRALALIGAAILFLARRPGRVAAGSALLAALAAVALNALAWQTSRHPAPLFAKTPAVERTPQAMPAPLPPVRPAAAAPIPAAPAPPAAAPVPAKSAPPRDAIAELIRAGDPSNSLVKDSSQKIAAAQRALTKLGYGPLKADGVPGPGTRAAIEKFERERRLAVTGELNPRTMRELSVEARIPIE